MDFLIFLALLALGFTAGTIAEKRHYGSIERRERAVVRLPVATFPQGAEPPLTQRVKKVRFVSGSAVISTDYFKRFLAGLRMIIGGRLTSYESLLDRARREAVLRMKYQAGGAAMILGMRIETATIGDSSRKSGTCMVEAFAYGTAVWMDEVRSEAS
jgi:uncharacterized protein YbjQ (UPF0145 family)